MGGNEEPKKAWKVDHQYFLRASPTAVFEAISRPESLVRWLSDSAEITLRKDGRYRIGWKDGPTHSGRLLEYDPGRSLTLSWEWEGVPLRNTRLRMSVEPIDDGALFHIEHSGFPAEERWGELYGGAEWGWTYFAMNLKSFVETGRDLRAKYDG
jgi:uncharacterized protein YndB with AHSA1/START domain